MGALVAVGNAVYSNTVLRFIMLIPIHVFSNVHVA